ncbi:MAG: hypothetical protein GQ574_13680 [Crocinitomix sp.]|nr:hypothetical protein [Crocinitomix sp.]
MSKNLHITNDEITFSGTKVGEISASLITKSFKIKFDKIHLVVISPRLAFDDEALIVTIIDRNKNFHQFSCQEFGGDEMMQFELRLGLKSIRNIEWGKFSWKEHENYITDKIIYPKELYWEDLFIPPEHLEKRIVQLAKFLAIKKSISGELNPRIAAYLEKQSIEHG